MLNKGDCVAEGSQSATGERKSAKDLLIHLKLATPGIMPQVQKIDETRTHIRDAS